MPTRSSTRPSRPSATTRSTAPAGAGARAQRDPGQLARSAVEWRLDNDVIDTVLDIVGEVAEEVDSLIDDIRDLDPGRDLAQQIGNLVLNRLTDAIHDRFRPRSAHQRALIDFTMLAYIAIASRWAASTYRSTPSSTPCGRPPRDGCLRRGHGGRSESARHGLRPARHACRRRTPNGRARPPRTRGSAPSVPRWQQRLACPDPAADERQRRRRPGPPPAHEVEGLSRAAVEDQADRPSVVCVFLNGRNCRSSSFTVTETGIVKPPSMKPVPGPLRSAPGSSTCDRTGRRSGLRPTRDAARRARRRQAWRRSLLKRAPSPPAVPFLAAPPRAVQGQRPSAGAAPISGRSGGSAGRSHVTQIGLITRQATGGVVLSCLLNGSELGTRPQHAGRGGRAAGRRPPSKRPAPSSVRRRERQKPKPTPSKPGAIRLPGLRPVKPADLVPQKIAGKFVLLPKKTGCSRSPR